MAQKAFPLDNTDYYAEDVRLFHVGRTSGIFNVTKDDLRVKANGGMQVSITPGYAFLLAAKNGVGGITYGNTSEVVFNVDTASVIVRYDYISVRYTKITNKCELVYTKGTSTKPTYAVRNESQYEIILAIIQVPANAESIQDKDIIDTRLDENLCGITIDGMIKLPTEGMNAQFQSFYEEVNFENVSFQNENAEKFREWFDSLEGTLQRDVAASLAGRIVNIEDMLTKNHFYADLKADSSTALIDEKGSNVLADWSFEVESGDVGTEWKYKII